LKPGLSLQALLVFQRAPEDSPNKVDYSVALDANLGTVSQHLVT
jgi:hypothetical protein